MSSARPVVDVAVGIVIRPADGWILIGQRPAGKPFEGWWEFPGGKFEPGETPAQATARELDEELGIQIFDSQPWVVREHIYPHAHVRLHFRRVTAWQGTPHSREGQAFAWCHPAAIDVAPLLPASLAPIRWLGLPPVYPISDATARGNAAWLACLDRWLARQAVPDGGGAAAGVRHAGLLLLREPAMPPERFDGLFRSVLAALAGTGVRLLVSSRHPLRFIEQAAADTGGGVHLTGEDMYAQLAGHGSMPIAASPQAGHQGADVVGNAPEGRAGGGSAPAAGTATPQPAARQSLASADEAVSAWPWRPDLPLVAASCHSADDLAAAGQLGVDLAVCGPVQPTLSHPEAPALGWSDFGVMIARSPVPVYALGGMQPGDMADACAAGAQGIAMQRAAWGTDDTSD